MAASLVTFEPTRPMRLAGLLGLIGGIVLLWIWLAWNPFGDRGLNTVRLLLFWSGGVAVVLALYRRQAAVSARLALLATGAVVATGAANIAWLLLATVSPSPFAGSFGLIGFMLGLAGWLAAAGYGAAILATRSARAGMSRTLANTTPLAAGCLIVGGLLAPLGMDRFGLEESVRSLGAIGVSLTGIGWLVLGAVLVFAGRGRRRTG